MIANLRSNGARMKVYDGKSKAKLGTKKNPAVVTVQTEERRKAVAAIFHRGKPTESDVTSSEAGKNPAKPSLSRIGIEGGGVRKALDDR